MIGAVVSFYWIWRLYSQILQSDHQCLSHRPILEHICKSIFSELSVHICDMLSHVELYPLTLQFSVYGVKAFCRRHIYAAYSWRIKYHGFRIFLYSVLYVLLKYSNIREEQVTAEPVYYHVSDRIYMLKPGYIHKRIISRQYTQEASWRICRQLNNIYKRKNNANDNSVDSTQQQYPCKCSHKYIKFCLVHLKESHRKMKLHCTHKGWDHYCSKYRHRKIPYKACAEQQ